MDLNKRKTGARVVAIVDVKVLAENDFLVSR